MLPECFSPRCVKDGDKGRRRSVDSLLQTLQQANYSLNEENVMLKNDVVHAEDKVQQLTHELTQKQMLLELYKKEIETLEHSSGENRDSEFQSKISTLEAHAHQLEHEKWELTTELDARKEELEERQSKYESLKQTFVKQTETLKMKMANHKDAIRAHEERNAALQKEKEALQDKLSTWYHVVDKVQTDLELKDQQIEEFAKRERSILEEMRARQKEINDLRKLYEARRDEAKRLRMSSPIYDGRPRSYSVEDYTDHHCAINLKDELENCLRTTQTTPDLSPISSPDFKVFETIRSANMLLDEMERGRPRSGSERDPRMMQIDRLSTYSDSGCGDLGSDDEISASSFSGRPIATSQRRGRHSHHKKLQLIKPLEGSETLHQWQRLATPSLTKLFEPRHGVFSRHEMDSQRGIGLNWSDQGLGLGEPEEDDDPELDRTGNTDDSGFFPEVRQALTEEFMRGISCYGIQPHRGDDQEKEFTSDDSEIRPRSNSLAEKIHRSGIRARTLEQQNDRHSLSLDSLTTQTSANFAQVLSNYQQPIPRRNSVPSRLGLCVNSHNAFGRQISTPTSGLPHPEPTTGFGVGDLVTRQLLQFLKRCSTKSLKQTEEPISPTQSYSSFQGKSTSYTGPRLKFYRAAMTTGDDPSPAQNSPSAPALSRRRCSKLKVKIIKNKKPQEPVFPKLENQTDQGFSVLHTITSLRRNNMLVGGLPEAPPCSSLTSYLDDITMGIFSA